MLISHLWRQVFTKSKKLFCYSLVSFFSFIPFYSMGATSQGLNLPEYTILGNDSVDVATNQVSITLNGASIGNESFKLGYKMLSGDHGFSRYIQQNYHGWVMTVQKPDPEKYLHQDTGVIAAKEVVVGFSSYYFKISGSQYIPFADERLSLEKIGNYFIFTDVEGTEHKFVSHSFPESEYSGANSVYFGMAYLEEIKRRDGFTITIHRDGFGPFASLVDRFRVRSVTTNTGLQLKYIFDEDYTYNPSDESYHWFTRYPKEVIAVNNQDEYCAIYTDTCVLSNSWPTWSYSWPNGIPYRQMYNQTVDFIVTNPENHQTHYKHKVIPVEGVYATVSQAYRYHAVKISAIQQPSDTAPSITYEYVQVRDSERINRGLDFRHRASVESSNVKGDITNFRYPVQGGNTVVYTPEYVATSRRDTSELTTVAYNTYFGNVQRIKQRGKAEYFFESFSPAQLGKNLTYVEYPEGNSISLLYETRNNLTKRVSNPRSGSSDSTFYEYASYPSTCSNPKTCNQPEWVKDARGNQTDYTYHAASGMVATITKPANENGIRSQTRFSYQQFYARYKNPITGNMQQASTPIWLTSSQSECIKGAGHSSGNGCALGVNDEVVTTYHYGNTSQPNNLWLKGETVSTSNKSLTTCYQYDRLGNRIGETQPTSGLSTCL